MKTPMTPILVSLVGTTPLLCGRPASDLVPVGQESRAQAAARLYLDDEKNPVIPNLNLFRSFTGAARLLGRSPAEIVHHLGIRERAVPILALRGWAVDTRSVRQPQTGERTLCHRPRFDDWRLRFTLLIDQDAISIAEAHNVLTLAGQRIGLGDYRPERGGPFGRFAVTSWEVSS
jgi:hypothetical protein